LALGVEQNVIRLNAFVKIEMRPKKAKIRAEEITKEEQRITKM
jgi:hypothetical protein